MINAGLASQYDLELAVMQRIWCFERGDGSVIAPRIRLKRSGAIFGHNHSNEFSWGFSDGLLVLRNSRDEETTRFGSPTTDGEGKMIFKGQFLNSDVSHVLTEVKRTTGIGPMNVSPRVAVLVRTHLVNDKLFDLLDILSQSRRYDLFVSADETISKLDVRGYPKLPHSVELCHLFGLPTKHSRILWQCGDYPLYFAASEKPNYDYYIMIEYDVDLSRKSPIFLEGLISRFQDSAGNWYDLVTDKFSEPRAEWYWTKSAKAAYPKVYSTGLFAFLAISSRAIAYLLEERQKEARRGVSDFAIIHCEAFCASALAAGGYSCVSINDLIEGATEPGSFHTPSFDLENSHYLLDQYHIRSPHVELVHPVFDLDEYLHRQFKKALEKRELASYYADLRKLEHKSKRERMIIAKYAEMASAALDRENAAINHDGKEAI